MKRPRSILFCLTFFATTIAPSQAFPERDPLVGFLDYQKGKSDATYDKIERGLATIPKDVRQALLESGYTVVIAPTMLSAKPGWQGAVPQGWSPDSNYDNVGGLFEPGTHRIVIPETVSSPEKWNVYEPNNRAELTIRHEVGHAYDNFQGYVSRSDDFVFAYTKDTDKLADWQQERYHYFLQPNYRGCGELFAELFAAAYTPDSAENHRYKDLLKAFPNTTKLVMQLSPHRPASAKKPMPIIETTSAISQEHKDVPASQSSKPGDPMRDQLKSTYASIVSLYKAGKLAEANSLIPSYVKLMESGYSSGSIDRDRLAQTYAFQASLLQRLNKSAEAKAVVAKENALKQTVYKAASQIAMQPAPKQTAQPKTGQAARSSYGVVGIKFVLTVGQLPVINRLFDGGPAAQAGLQAGDVITAVNGTPLSPGITKESVYDMIIGEVGTPVSITVSRADKPYTVKLTRVSTDSFDQTTQRDYLYNR